MTLAIIAEQEITMKTNPILSVTTRAFCLVAIATIATHGSQAKADSVTLGQAFSFGVLARSTTTNTGTSVVSGNVGITPGTAMTGFTPGTIVNGTTHLNDSMAIQAQNDLAVAYNVIAGETPNQNLTGQDLGGLTLLPGVYRFDSSAQLTGTLILDAQGDPNARFDFQMGSTLTTASGSLVKLINSGNIDHVFWQVGSSATLGTNTLFAGNILALTSITMNTGASNLGGRTLARNGAVTLDANQLGVVVVPEASTVALLSCAGLPLTFALLRRRK